MNRPQNSSLHRASRGYRAHIKRPSLLQVFEDVAKRVRCLSHLKMFVKGTKHNEKKGKGIEQYFLKKIMRNKPAYLDWGMGSERFQWRWP